MSAPRSGRDRLLDRAAVAGTTVVVGAIALAGVLTAKIANSSTLSHSKNTGQTGGYNPGSNQGSNQNGGFDPNGGLNNGGFDPNGGFGGGGGLSPGQNQGPVGGSNGS